MTTMAQRIEELRIQRNLSRPALAAALGLPRTAIEKFETGRLTPTQDQQKKMAAYFEVSLAQLRGEEDGMSAWMEGAYLDEPTAAPVVQPKRVAKVERPSTDSSSGSMMDALLASGKFQEALREAALEVLRSKEGQEILANVVRKELASRGR